jgi:hypothetical protein
MCIVDRRPGKNRRALFLVASLATLLTSAASLSAAGTKPTDKPVPGASRPNPTAGPLGTLSGQFVFGGPRPERKLLDIPAEPVKAKDGRVYGVTMDFPYFHKFKIYDNSLLVGEDGGIANVVVWLRSKNVPVPTAAELPPITVTAKEGYIEPRIVICCAPRKLIIKNEEDIALMPNYQGRFSQFNPQIKPHERFTYTVNPEYVPIRFGHLLCWQHVVGYVLPLSHPYAAQSDSHGNFRIEGLPPGEWEFNVWHERKGYVKTDNWPKGRFTFTIKPGDNSLGTITLGPALFDD